MSLSRKVPVVESHVSLLIATCNDAARLCHSLIYEEPELPDHWARREPVVNVW